MPLACAGNSGKFQVVATANDRNGHPQAVAARIKLPWREGSQRVQLKVGAQSEIKITPNKVEIKAPDPEALLAQLQRDGGILVENGQVVQATRKAASQQGFKLVDGVWQIAAPALELQVGTTGADGFTNLATVTADITCNEAPVVQGDNANAKGQEHGKGNGKGNGNGNGNGKGEDKDEG